MVFCIVHCMLQSAMMANINVQCILDCLSVSVSTEPVHSDDQFANSYWNPYKLYINVLNHTEYGMLTTFPQCNFSLEFPQIVSQNHTCYH